MQNEMTWFGSKRIKRLCRIKGIEPKDFGDVSAKIIQNFLSPQGDDNYDKNQNGGTENESKEDF